MSVRAKFNCNSITEYSTNLSVQMTAVYGKEGENADFAKYTPSGTFQINVDKETKAAAYFKVGKEYYIDIAEAIKEE